MESLPEGNQPKPLIPASWSWLCLRDYSPVHQVYRSCLPQSVNTQSTSKDEKSVKHTIIHSERKEWKTHSLRRSRAITKPTETGTQRDALPGMTSLCCVCVGPWFCSLGEDLVSTLTAGFAFGVPSSPWPHTRWASENKPLLGVHTFHRLLPSCAFRGSQKLSKSIERQNWKFSIKYNSLKA